MALDFQSDYTDPFVPAAFVSAKPKILFFFKALIYMVLVRYKYFSPAVQSGLLCSAYALRAFSSFSLARRLIRLVTAR
jgi:hypothetical protein